MNFQEISAKLLRLRSSAIVVLLLVLVIWLFTWMPWPLVLVLVIGAYVGTFRFFGRWSEWRARQTAIPVYQPPSDLQPPTASPYQQGYQPQTPGRPASWSPFTGFTQQSNEPQPKQDLPGAMEAVYEQPLAQYPDQP